MPPAKTTKAPAATMLDSLTMGELIYVEKKTGVMLATLGDTPPPLDVLCWLVTVSERRHDASYTHEQTLALTQSELLAKIEGGTEPDPT